MPDREPPAITCQMVIAAYMQGAFPMADSRKGEVGWYQPDPRAILPLEDFKVPRSLQKVIRKGTYRVTIDSAFEQVIRACAEPRQYTDETWINDEIINVYTQLHLHGITHSIEAWQDDELVGGLYGLALGGAFFGESMFSKATDASKVCLVHLVEHLRQQEFQLLDTQIYNEHMAQFGVIEISHDQYMQQLQKCLQLSVYW